MLNHWCNDDSHSNQNKRYIRKRLKKNCTVNYLASRIKAKCAVIARITNVRLVMIEVCLSAESFQYYWNPKNELYWITWDDPLNTKPNEIEKMITKTILNRRLYSWGGARKPGAFHFKSFHIFWISQRNINSKNLKKKNKILETYWIAGKWVRYRAINHILLNCA